jgi:hypothetical protein
MNNTTDTNPSLKAYRAICLLEKRPTSQIESDISNHLPEITRAIVKTVEELHKAFDTPPRKNIEWNKDQTVR